MKSNTYLLKNNSNPFKLLDFLHQIEKALENRRLTSEVKRLQQLLQGGKKYDFANISARSENIREGLEVWPRTQSGK